MAAEFVSVDQPFQNTLSAQPIPEAFFTTVTKNHIRVIFQDVTALNSTN